MVEEPTAESELVIHKLSENLLDAEIVYKLGGISKMEVTLSELYVLLVKQGVGQNGVLLTDGYANIAYIRDVNGNLRAVIAHWDGGWYLDVGQITDPDRFVAGRRVVSRK